jgi:diguanylate cyclase (GGDEF)-like protein
MNAKRFNELLLFAILLTFIAMVLHNYLPIKRLSLIPSSYTTFLWGTNNDDGTAVSFWADEKKYQWGCNIKEPINPDKACSFIVGLNPDAIKGMDLSGFDKMLINLDYQGTNDNLRIYLRNFNPIYSNKEDKNSTKFHSALIAKKDLSSTVVINLDEFTVADWWVGLFNIDRKHAVRDLTNVVEIGIGLENFNAVGEHKIYVNSIELTGEWVSSSNWYLTILSVWMLGIFAYALSQLRFLKLQTEEDNRRIYQLEKQSNEFRRLSTVDPLTQCYNRFGIHQIITRLESPEYNAHTSYSLIMIDIDFFKRINDRRGHDAGDRVLQSVAEIVHNEIPDQYYLGRWGGEEFIIVLPDATKEIAFNLAEKIRMAIFTHIFEQPNPLNVTASFGISEHLATEDFATSFKRADQALYEAKHHGRNCCVISEE